MKKFNFTNDGEKGSNGSVTVDRARKRRWDIGPRILCFLIAVFIWIYMVNLNDTDVEETITFTIEIVGEDKLHESNMAIYGMDKKTVTVTVKGSNRDLKKYSETDYKVTVDVSTLSSSGEHSLQVNVLPPASSSIELIKCEPSTVLLYSDVNIEKEIPLKVELGDVITYQNAEPTLRQSADTVKIMGPNAIVDKIDYAKYEINGDLESSLTYSGFSLSFFDKNDTEISFGDYDYIDYSTKDITVNVDVILHITIPVKVRVQGVGNDLVATTDIEQVGVYGDRLLIKQFTDLVYVINLDSAESGGAVYYTLTDFDLPEGIFLEESDVHVKISFTDP